MLLIVTALGINASLLYSGYISFWFNFRLIHSKGRERISKERKYFWPYQEMVISA